MVRNLHCALATAALLVGLCASAATAQEGDFWSESVSPGSEDGNAGEDSDFWSDTDAPADEQGFWSSSSAAEVDRRRRAVLAERERVRAERVARQKAEREIRRLREEERRAQAEYERQLAQNRSRSGGRANMGSWGKIAQAVRTGAGIAQSGIDAVNADTRRREAQRRHTARMNDLRRKREQMEAERRSRRDQIARLEREQLQRTKERRRVASSDASSSTASGSVPGGTASTQAANTGANSVEPFKPFKLCISIAEERAKKAELNREYRAAIANVPGHDYKRREQIRAGFSKRFTQWQNDKYRACGVKVGGTRGSVRE